MRLSSSSTSSSERRSGARRRLRRRICAVACWTAAALAGIDIAVGIVARPPADPRQPGNAIQDYFSYGGSIESKLKRAAGADDARAAPIFVAGWIDEECGSRPREDVHGGISVYGMSFSNHVADQMVLLRPALQVARFAGPAAPPSHSYACFLSRIRAGTEQSSVVLFAVLGSSVRRMASLSGMTTSFEQPMPFTYPRYRLQSGQLTATEPLVRSAAQLRRTLADPDAWRTYVESLKEGDFFYDGLITRSSLIDHSVALRLASRSLGQRSLASRTQELLGDGTYSGDPSLVPTLQAMLLDFAARVRAKQALPVVLLFEDRGSFGVLRRNVVPVLEDAQVPYVLSSDVMDIDDPGNFVGDGHFIAAVDRRIAERVIAIVFPSGAAE